VVRALCEGVGRHVEGVVLKEVVSWFVQVSIGNRMNEQAGLGGRVKLVKQDFYNMEMFEDGHFDGAYAIEATCHAADRARCYSEIFRVLRPGGYFAGYEWCLTPKYDPKNRQHVDLKSGIEIGDGLPDILTFDDIVEALEEAGFEVEVTEDVALRGHIPWYGIFVHDKFSWETIKTHPAFVLVTDTLVTILETIGLATHGSSEMHRNLVRGMVTLRDGGATGIFTPSFYFRARKPLDARSTKPSKDGRKAKGELDDESHTNGSAKRSRTPASDKRSKSPKSARK